MADIFEKHRSGLDSPATHLVEVTPSDDRDLDQAGRAINVARSGNVRVTTVGGTTATVHVVAGGAFPVRVKRVWATGTTASSIVVMF